MRLQSYPFAAIAATLISLSACNTTDTPKVPDVSNIPLTLKINRFDQDLLAIDTNHIEAGLKALEAKYPAFTNFYFTKIIAVKQPNDTSGAYRTKAAGFLRFPPTRKTLDTIQIVFKDADRIQKEIEQGFRYFKYYFPERPIPEIYTIPTDFNYAVAIPPTDNMIALGLDMYLGADFQGYQDPDLPRFMVRTYDKKYLTLRAFQALINDIAGNPHGNRLLDIMIQNGKKMYALDLLLPTSPDSIKWEWTEKQTNWVKENEVAIYAHLLDRKLLYSTNLMDINKLVNNSPNSPGMPPEAPGRVANYIGYKIIKEFIRRNPKTTLSVLMNTTDAQAILDASKYKPDK